MLYDRLPGEAQHTRLLTPAREPMTSQSDCSKIQLGESVSFSWDYWQECTWGVTCKSRDDSKAAVSLNSPPQHWWCIIKAVTPGISTQPAGRWHTSVITGQLRFTLWLFPRHVTSVHFQSLLSPLFSPGGNVSIWREVPGSKSAYHDDHCVNSIELLKISNVCIFIINVKCVFRNTLLILTSLV